MWESIGKRAHGTLGHNSHLTEPLWTDPGLKNGISVRELISTLKKKKKKKKHRRGINCWTISQILACKEKATTTTTAIHIMFFKKQGKWYVLGQNSTPLSSTNWHNMAKFSTLLRTFDAYDCDIKQSLTSKRTRVATVICSPAIEK